MAETTGPIGISISGEAPTPESVREMRDAVIAILNTSAGDTVKIEAIKAVHAAGSVKDMHFNNANVRIGDNTTIHNHKEPSTRDPDFEPVDEDDGSAPPATGEQQ